MYFQEMVPKYIEIVNFKCYIIHYCRKIVISNCFLSRKYSTLYKKKNTYIQTFYLYGKFSMSWWYAVGCHSKWLSILHKEVLTLYRALLWAASQWWHCCFCPLRCLIADSKAWAATFLVVIFVLVLPKGKLKKLINLQN